jgi:hypothetical protein
MREHSSVTKQVRAQTLRDDAPIRSRWGRIQQVVAAGPLKRTMLCELIASGEINSFVLKKKGARRGLRLIDLNDLDRWLQAAAKEAGKGEV